MHGNGTLIKLKFLRAFKVKEMQWIDLAQNAGRPWKVQSHIRKKKVAAYGLLMDAAVIAEAVSEEEMPKGMGLE